MRFQYKSNLPTVAEMATSQEHLAALQKKQKIIDREPFRNLRIDDAKILDSIEGREICDKCYRSRKFFCYTCYSPVIDRKYFPRVKVRCFRNKLIYAYFYMNISVEFIYSYHSKWEKFRSIFSNG